MTLPRLRLLLALLAFVAGGVLSPVAHAFTHAGEEHHARHTHNGGEETAVSAEHSCELCAARLFAVSTPEVCVERVNRPLADRPVETPSPRTDAETAAATSRGPPARA